MFKILAGIFILVVAFSSYQTGGDKPTIDICVTIAIALIGAGLDTIFHKK